MKQVVGLQKQGLWSHFSTAFDKIGIYGKLTMCPISLCMNCHSIKYIIIKKKSKLYIALSLSYLLSKVRQFFLKTLLVWTYYISLQFGSTPSGELSSGHLCTLQFITDLNYIYLNESIILLYINPKCWNYKIFCLNGGEQLS